MVNILGQVEVNATFEQIITALRAEVMLKGYPYLKDIRIKHNSIQVTCPYHSLGQENNPSAGILTIEKEGLKDIFISVLEDKTKIYYRYWSVFSSSRTLRENRPPFFVL